MLIFLALPFLESHVVGAYINILAFRLCSPFSSAHWRQSFAVSVDWTLHRLFQSFLLRCLNGFWAPLGVLCWDKCRRACLQMVQTGPAPLTAGELSHFAQAEDLLLQLQKATHMHLLSWRSKLAKATVFHVVFTLSHKMTWIYWEFSRSPWATVNREHISGLQWNKTSGKVSSSSSVKWPGLIIIRFCNQG